MPIIHCQKCGNLFHFLEPTSLAETEERLPSDLGKVCTECQKARVPETSDREVAKKVPANAENADSLSM
ncbi:MAG: hypothetical protein VXZ82_01685 [Planctomycetota bacterium]|nr:hypothetical protein [Planctomycetota bacterium]